MKIPASPTEITKDIARVRERFNLAEHLSQHEASVLDRPLGKLKAHEVHSGTWNAEAIRALGWALHGAKSMQEWPLRDRFSYGVIFYPSNLAARPVPSWLRRPVLRPAAEIERMRRIAALWTWRYRAHRLIESSCLTLAGIAALVDSMACRIPREAAALGIPTEQGDLRFTNGARFWSADGVDPFAWEVFAYGHPLRHHTLEWLRGFARQWDAIQLSTPEIVRALRPAHAPASWEWVKRSCEGRADRGGPMW